MPFKVQDLQYPQAHGSKMPGAILQQQCLIVCQEQNILSWEHKYGYCCAQMQMTEIVAMRRDEEQLREELKAAETQQSELEATLESVRLDAANKKAEQER